MQIIRKVYIKLFFSAFFWGGSSIAAKILMKEVPPSIATSIRFFGAMLALLFIFRIPAKNVKLSLSEHFKLFLLGITGITLCYFFYFKGLFFSSTYNAALIEATIPLITLLISVILKREVFNRGQFIGFLISYLGIIVIVTQLNFKIITSLSFNIGDIMLLLSTVFFGIYNVLYKDFSFKIPSTLQTYYIFLYGSIGLIPWLFYDIFINGGLKINISLIGTLCALFLALGSSVAAYLFFNEGIKVLGASKASGFINYVPIVTIILTLIVLRDIPAFFQIIGAVIVLTGIYISQRKINNYELPSDIIISKEDINIINK